MTDSIRWSVPAKSELVLSARGHLIPVSHDFPTIMGILNASPESFSDGGVYPTLESQVDAALAMVDEGATIIDVGGESGVTGVNPLTPAEERRRVERLVRVLARQGVLVSVDTWKAEVAAAVLEAGAVMINDVSGLADPAIARQCARNGAALVIMHTRARPKHKDFPHLSSEAAVADISTFLGEKIELAESLGMARDRIVLDPGPDFGKTPAQTVAVLAHLADLRQFGCPILLAVSRKDSIGAITGRRPLARLGGTLAALAAGVAQGAGMVRVHDVAAVRDYLTIAATLSGNESVSEDLRIPAHLKRQSPISAGDG
jgi:dihydropteroate synthase